MIREKRKTRRIKEDDKVAIEVITDSKDLQIKKIYYVLSKNISQAGIEFEADTFFPVDACLKLKIFLENPQRLISIHGKVRWIKCNYTKEIYKMGIEFTDISSDSIKILKEHINKVDE
jgi:c-di-GMP-binding flagellar brake protein YcgR